MTRMMDYEFICSECQTSNKVTTEDSITTWLYPELVQKILNDDYFFLCVKCGSKNKIVKQILVNTRKGMYMMDTGADLESNKQQLIEYGVIDEEGNILKQEKKPSSEVQHDEAIAPIVEAIEKKVKEFRDELLEEKDENN